MTAHPAPANDPTQEPASHYRELLHELLDAGMDVVRMLRAQANSPAPHDDPARQALDLATAYDRVARAIRRTVMLAQRLDAPAPPTAAQHRAAARRQVIREVEDVIDRDARAAERDPLRAELQQRLDGPDLLDDIDHRPVPDIVASICRDLGLANFPGLPRWRRRTPTDIAALCARAASPPPAAAAPLGGSEHFFRLVPTPNTRA